MEAKEQGFAISKGKTMMELTVITTMNSLGLTQLMF